MKKSKKVESRKEWIKFRVRYRIGFTSWEYRRSAAGDSAALAKLYASIAFGDPSDENRWSSLEWAEVEAPPKEWLARWVSAAESALVTAVNELKDAAASAARYESAKGGSLEPQDVEPAREFLRRNFNCYLTKFDVINFVDKFGVHPLVAAKKLRVRGVYCY